MAASACHPCYPGSPSIGSGSFRQDRCSGLPPCITGSTTPLSLSRLHLGSLALRPAGLLDSLKEPLSRNLAFQVTLYTSLKLHGRTTELPWSDFNRQVIRFPRHTIQRINGGPKDSSLKTATARSSVRPMFLLNSSALMIGVWVTGQFTSMKASSMEFLFMVSTSSFCMIHPN